MKATIKHKKQITPSIIEVDLQVLDRISFTPGQYINITIEEPFNRPYSVIEYKDSVLKILVGNGNPGLGADYFTNAKIGEELEISEPMGNYGIKVSGNNKIFIATGSGLAPFIPMIKSLKEKILLIYGIKNYDEDLSQIFLSEVSNLEVIRCISDENIKITNLNDINSRVTSYLKDNDLDWKNSDFYICGRNEMIVQVSEILENKGVKNIYKENYG